MKQNWPCCREMPPKEAKDEDGTSISADPDQTALGQSDLGLGYLFRSFFEKVEKLQYSPHF